MAIYTNLPIYKASYRLMLNLSRIMPNMPRDCRYSLGQDTRQRVMDIIILIYNANREHNKLQKIRKMQELIVEVQVYVRLMSDMKYLSEGAYLELVEQIVSIMKQMSAWEKHERYKQNSKEDDCGSVELPRNVDGYGSQQRG